MSWDVAVVGGGLAGAAAASHLAAAGRRVVLFERERGPHDKVCGEFLSGTAAAELAELGAAPGRLGGAPIGAVRLVSGRVEAAASLPFPAWGLSRRRLDESLLQAALQRGVAVRRGSAIRELRADGAGGVRLRAADGETGGAAAALLATGKHDLRGWRRPGASGLVGLKMHLEPAEAQRRALAGHVELVLFQGGYAGLQLVEGGTANLCLVVERGRYAALGRDWRRLAAAVPHLARRLDGARARWPRPIAVAGMPYGHLHRPGADAAATAGPVYRLGDQVAVVPSFTGDGMAMALRSARRAADAVVAGRAADAYHRGLAAAFGGPMRLAGLVAGAASGPAAGQALLVAACRAAPWLIGRIAAGTRAGQAAAAA